MADSRRVVLVCGPPGAGKSTLARELAERDGLTVYDRDEPKWRGSEKTFRQALERVGRDGAARAVVIRAGATRSARARAQEVLRATEVHVLTPPPQVCIERIVARKQGTAPIRSQIQSVESWYRRYNSSGRRARPKASPKARGYGDRHRALRKRLAPKVAAGVVRCARCGELILPGEPWDLGHDDNDRRRYTGPEHQRCNRATAGRRRKRRHSRRW